MRSFFDFFGRIEEREVVLEEMASLLKSGELVLDIATGSGYLARQMTTQRVVCLDMDPAVVHRTAGILPGTYVCADATCMPFHDDVFDVAVAWTGVAHIPDWRALFQETARVTKEGGKIINCEPRGEYAVRAFRDFGCTHPMPSVDEMVEALGDRGNVKVTERDYFIILEAGP